MWMHSAPFSASGIRVSSRMINPKYSESWNWTSSACNPFGLTWDHQKCPQWQQITPLTFEHTGQLNVACNSGALSLIQRKFACPSPERLWKKYGHSFSSDGSDVLYLDERGILYCFKVLSGSARPPSPCSYIHTGDPQIASHQSFWDTWVRSLGWEDPLEEGKAIHTPVFWPGEFHGLYSPWGHKESDTTEWPWLSVFVILFFFSFSKVFNTRKVWLLTLFYHILEFSVHLLFPSGLSLHLRLWNATYFSRGSLKGLLANPTPNNKNNKNKIPPPTIFPKPWSICLRNSYVIYYKIL